MSLCFLRCVNMPFLKLKKVVKYLNEIHKNISETLHIIPPALLYAQVGVYAGVPSRTGQVLVLPVGYVLVRAGVPVLFGKTEVDYVDEVALFA